MSKAVFWGRAYDERIIRNEVDKIQIYVAYILISYTGEI
jgi:hypothetical protein